LEQIGLTTSNKTLQNEKGITDKKLSERVLDLLEDGTAPRIAYCLIEEYMKLKVPSAVGLLTKSGKSFIKHCVFTIFSKKALRQFKRV
jgi:hypothetical protein